MPVTLPPIRVTEPKTPAAFIKAGHPYLGFTYGLLWRAIGVMGPIAIIAFAAWHGIG